LIACANDLIHLRNSGCAASSLLFFCCTCESAVVVVRSSEPNKSRCTTRLVTHSSTTMEAFNSRLESFAKTRRVKQSSKRTVSIKWPHPAHFLATPDTLTEAGFFYNPARGTPDNVECFFCGKCLDGWEEEDDPFAIHWDKCRDSCAWAVLRCGLSEDVDRKGKCVSPFHVAPATL
jgi:hypothetical protein